MHWGVCLGGEPSPEELHALGVGWVRVVALPGIDWHVQRYRQAGIRVAGVIARESGDPAQYVGLPWSALVIGNEMDQIGEASWTLDPQEYADLWHRCATLYPHVPRLVGGLASGIVAAGLPYIEAAPDAAGFAVHPYAKRAEEARSLLREYKARCNLPLWVTEWHRDAWEIGDFMRMLSEECVGACWFAWDASVPGFELVGEKYAAMWAALREETVAETQTRPEFVLGFRELADKLGEAVVGDPVEDEHWINNRHSEQQTTKGLMRYSKQGNQAIFMPGLTLPN